MDDQLVSSTVFGGGRLFSDATFGEFGDLAFVFFMLLSEMSSFSAALFFFFFSETRSPSIFEQRLRWDDFFAKRATRKDFKRLIRMHPTSFNKLLSKIRDDLEVDETIWATFDPLSKLDREAMQFEVEITGGARVLTDFMGDQFGQSPIDLETFEIRKLELEALGAKAEASGEFDIAGDASRSDGAMDVTVEGAFAMLDSLAAAGLVPAPALGAYKALVEQFSVRDGDDDKLTTRIESRRGQVSINGRVVSQ